MCDSEVTVLRGMGFEFSGNISRDGAVENWRKQTLKDEKYFAVFWFAFCVHLNCICVARGRCGCSYSVCVSVRFCCVWRLISLFSSEIPWRSFGFLVVLKLEFLIRVAVMGIVVAGSWGCLRMILRSQISGAMRAFFFFARAQPRDRTNVRD